MVETSITWPSRPISESPIATVKIAVAIGSAIATTVPNVNSRMITAAARPIASLDSVAGFETSWPR